MNNTATPWGEEYERIKSLLTDRCQPTSDDAMTIAKNVLDQLAADISSLPKHEQVAFVYVLGEELVTLAVQFRVLVSVHNGQCITRDEANSLSDTYLNEAIAG